MYETQRHECGCVSRSRRWSVPGWDCFSTELLQDCGTHEVPAPKPVPVEDWEAKLLASIR